MAKQSYQVQYHVVGVFYLEQGQEISGLELAKLWAGTSIFGKHKVTGAFWHEKTVPKSTRKKIELGALDQIQTLLNKGNMPIFGGGVYVKSRSVARDVLLDRDFYYGHTSASRGFGYDTQPYLIYTVSGQWFEGTGPNVVLNHLREHFEAADRLHSPYGLIDLATSEDCYGGEVYQDAWSTLNISLHRWAEQFKWLTGRSKRRGHARGVYWGNYFGSEILSRLGGREHFLTRFRQHAQKYDGTPSALVWEFANGVFIGLCLDPLKCKPGQPLDNWAISNLNWLVLELGSHGVLNPWGSD